MRILILDTYYLAFLNSFYSSDLANQPYDTQWRSLMDQCFGTADFYSKNLKELGFDAKELIVNCEPLQRQWAKENGISLDKTEQKWNLRLKKRLIPWPQRIRYSDWFYKILIAQVKDYHPDVLYILDMNSIKSPFLHEVKQYVKFIAGQIACPFNPEADFKEYDLVLSSFPHFVDNFRRLGLTSEYFKLGFEARLLNNLQKENIRHKVVFIGGLSPSHKERIQFLEAVAYAHPFEVFGYGVDSIDSNSPLYKAHRGDAWAIDMYKILHSSDIALNHHINVAGNYANNMRLYETTGVGTLLITDSKDNIPDLFEPGKEVVLYSSPQECVELIGYYMEHEQERQSIAQNGQSRTLREHTYFERMKELTFILERHLHA